MVHPNYKIIIGELISILKTFHYCSEHSFHAFNFSLAKVVALILFTSVFVDGIYPYCYKSNLKQKVPVTFGNNLQDQERATNIAIKNSWRAITFEWNQVKSWY